MTQNFRTIQPVSHEIKSLKLVEPEHFLLNNGIPVYAINTGSEDIIKLDLVFDAGSIYQSQPLVAALSNKCLQEGTTNYSSKEIANRVDYFGAFLRQATSKDDARISLYCLSKHLDDLLPLLSEVAFQPIFPAGEVSTIIAKSKHEFLVNMQKVKFIARLRFNSLVFGNDHPYGTSSKAEDFDKLDSEKLIHFHKEFYLRKPYKIFVSGKLPKNIREKLDNYFGQYQIKRNGAPFGVSEINPSPQHEHFIKKDDSLQCALRIGKLLFNKHHPDFIKMQVVNTILGGYFGSRLMTNIREDKGYTYGISSIVTSLQQSGIFTISSEVGTDVKQKALDEIFIEIEKLRTNLVPEEELMLVKNYLLGVFLRSADGPFALSELVKSVVDYNFNLDYYDRFLETVKNTTAKEIKDLAVKYLDPGSMITLVVGE